MFVATDPFFKDIRRIREILEIQPFLRVGENICEIEFQKRPVKQT